MALTPTPTFIGCLSFSPAETARETKLKPKLSNKIRPCVFMSTYSPSWPTEPG